jgi:hypothetical protein
MLGAEDVKKIQQEVQTTTVETQVESSQTQETSAGSNVDFVIPQQIASLKVAELFGLSTTELQQYDIEIKRLLDYVDTFNPKSLDDIIFHIKHLDAQIGTTMGENKLKTLSRYLFLNREKDYLERQMERMKGL